MNDRDSERCAAAARRMVFGDPTRLAAAPSLDKALEVDAMSTDASANPDPADQTQQVARDIARELHQFASRPEGQQAPGGAPEGAQAALGGLVGGILTDAILAKVKDWSQEELALLGAYFLNRARTRIGELTGGL